MNNIQEPIANEDAERAVIGSCIITPASFEYLRTVLQGMDFWSLRHVHIWAAMERVDNEHRRLVAQGIDPNAAPAIDSLTVENELRAMSKLDLIGGAAYLTGLLIDTPHSYNVRSYARIVRNLSIRRQVISGAQEMIQLANEDNLTSELVGAWDSKSAVFKGVSSMRRDKTLAELIEDDNVRVQSILDGAQPEGVYTTGFTDLDSKLGGWNRGDMIVPAGRPGMGKSAFLLGTGLAAAKQGAHVAILSLEMSNAALTRRGISTLGDISANLIKRGELSQAQYSAYLKGSASLAEYTDRIHMRQLSRATPRSIEQTLHEIRATAGGLDIVILDYLQLVQSDNRRANRYETVTEVSAACKAMALQFNVAFIVAAQLSRAVEQRQDKRPLLSDLRESGGIEQDADIVLLFYRDAYYNTATEFPNQADIIVAKHRDGPTGIVSVYFDKTTMRFMNGRQIDVSLSRNGAHSPSVPF